MGTPTEAFSPRPFIAGFAGFFALVLLLLFLWQWGVTSGAADWFSRQDVHGKVTFAKATPLYATAKPTSPVQGLANSGETCQLVKLEPQKTFAWFKAACSAERSGWFLPAPEDQLSRTDTNLSGIQ
jgi:hypothetical protein